jgi:hypothetical protein
LIQVPAAKDCVKFNEIPIPVRRNEPNQTSRDEKDLSLGRPPRGLECPVPSPVRRERPPGDRGPDIARGWQGKCALSPRVAVRSGRTEERTGQATGARATTTVVMIGLAPGSFDRPLTLTCARKFRLDVFCTLNPESLVNLL